MAASLSSLLAYALTGDEVPIRDTDGTTKDFLAALGEAGWPPERISRLANQAWEQESRWPYPLPPHALDDVGPAQWYAALTDVRTVLGLDAIRQAPSKRTVLNEAERRLMADLPPHHGRVG